MRLCSARLHHKQGTALLSAGFGRSGRLLSLRCSRTGQRQLREGAEEPPFSLSKGGIISFARTNETNVRASVFCRISFFSAVLSHSIQPLVMMGIRAKTVRDVYVVKQRHELQQGLGLAHSSLVSALPFSRIDLPGVPSLSMCFWRRRTPHTARLDSLYVFLT